MRMHKGGGLVGFGVMLQGLFEIPFSPILSRELIDCVKLHHNKEPGLATVCAVMSKVVGCHGLYIVALFCPSVVMCC